MKAMAAALALLVAAHPAFAKDAPVCSIEAARTSKPLPHGCANALNLRAMVADPADLEGAAATPPPVGEPAVRAVGRHRDGTTPPLPAASSTGAPGNPGAP